MTSLRKFTGLGIEQFLAWVQDSARPALTPSLTEGELTTETFHDLEIDPSLKFATRLELGKYLVELLAGIDFNELMSQNNDGLWDWIAALYFGQLSEKGVRRSEHYVVTRKGSAGSLAYRHSVRTSYELVKIHGENAAICLNRPIHTYGDLTEQLASRQTIAHNKGFFQTACDLYIKGGSIRRGAASKPKKPKDRTPGDRTGFGSIRRLADALQRLDLTYDTDVMSSKQMVNILPKEFAKWK